MPFLPILDRGQVVISAQMALQGLEFSTVLQANEVVVGDRFLDRHRRRLRFRRGDSGCAI